MNNIPSPLTFATADRTTFIVSAAAITTDTTTLLVTAAVANATVILN